MWARSYWLSRGENSVGLGNNLGKIAKIILIKAKNKLKALNKKEIIKHVWILYREIGYNYNFSRYNFQWKIQEII